MEVVSSSALCGQSKWQLRPHEVLVVVLLSFVDAFCPAGEHISLAASRRFFGIVRMHVARGTGNYMPCAPRRCYQVKIMLYVQLQLFKMLLACLLYCGMSFLWLRMNPAGLLLHPVD